MARVWPHAHVGGLRPGEWNDTPDNAQLAGWVEMGLVALTDPHGGRAPDKLPRSRRCCGE